MNKKLIMALISAAGVSSAAQIIADVQGIQDLKIRTVNVLDIMRESQEGKKVSAEIEKLRTELTTDLEVAQAEYVKEAEAFKAKMATLSTDARKKSEETLIAKRHDLENLGKKAEDRLKHSMQAASDNLTDKAQKVVENYAKVNKLDIVFDTSSGRAVYCSPKTDLTKTMVSKMDSSFKKEAVKVADNKTAPKAKAITA